MSTRKFHRTIYSVEILSEEPIPHDLSLRTVLGMTEDGDYSGRTVVSHQEEINGKQAAAFLQVQGSEPGFFRLDENGNDID